MITLLAGDKLSVVSGAAGTLHAFVAHYFTDRNGRAAHRTVTPPITTIVTTVIKGSPGTGASDEVQFISVHNAHATVANAITIEITDGTNTAILWQGTLAAGEQVSYTAENGWQYLGAAGVPKAAA